MRKGITAGRIQTSKTGKSPPDPGTIVPAKGRININLIEVSIEAVMENSVAPEVYRTKEEIQRFFDIQGIGYLERPETTWAAPMSSWVGVVLCVASAFVLNRIGGRLPGKTLVAVGIACALYALSDINIEVLVERLGELGRLHAINLGA